LGGNPTAEEIEAALGSATAFDVCDGDLPVIVTDGDLVIDGCNYSQTRTFTALDDCGNESSISRTIYWIVDLEEPVIEKNCDVTTEENPFLGCNPSTEIIETAICTLTITDNCDEDVVIVTTSTDTIVEPGCIITLTRGTVAVDRYGNTATGSRSVSYKLDLDAPVLTASGSVEDGANLGGNPTAEEIEAALGSATAFDVCDGDLPVIVTDGDLVIPSIGL